jgi:hypothetical protein
MSSRIAEPVRFPHGWSQISLLQLLMIEIQRGDDGME